MYVSNSTWACGVAIFLPPRDPTEPSLPEAVFAISVGVPSSAARSGRFSASHSRAPVRRLPFGAGVSSAEQVAGFGSLSAAEVFASHQKPPLSAPTSATAANACPHALALLMCASFSSAMSPTRHDPLNCARGPYPVVMARTKPVSGASLRRPHRA